jgi:hypothetical protein
MGMKRKPKKLKHKHLYLAFQKKGQEIRAERALKDRLRVERNKITNPLIAKVLGVK